MSLSCTISEIQILVENCRF